MDSNTAASHLKDERTWRRLVYIVLFAIAFNVVEVILWALLVVQFLARLFSGRPIERAAVFGQNLASYVYQIVCFLTFRTDETPWPFAPWPDGPPVEPPPAKVYNAEPASEAAAEPAEKKTAGGPRKRARRAKPAKGASTATADDPA